MRDAIEEAAELLASRGRVVALTGAGISVESGIPDFRSAEGLWTRYSPSEYATIEAFLHNPRKVWRMLAEMDDLLDSARPNAGHAALAQLAEAGVLDGVITQNIDGLHQAAGSRRVIEFHGSHRTFTCLECGQRYDQERTRTLGMPPACGCGEVLKPDVIFFGESIPGEAMEESYRLASTCRTMLVVGTSAEVAPASQMPWLAKRNGALVIEVNIARSMLTGHLTDIFLQGEAGTVLQELADAALGRVWSRWGF